MSAPPRRAGGRAAYPAWARLPYALWVAVLVPVYWHHYGPGNFLWFSDIALFATLVALWTGNRLIASMMAARWTAAVRLRRSISRSADRRDSRSTAMGACTWSRRWRV